MLFLALPSWFYLCLLFRSVSVIYLAVGLCFYYFRLTQRRDPVCLLPDFSCFHPLYLVLVLPHTFSSPFNTSLMKTLGHLSAQTGTWDFSPTSYIFCYLSFFFFGRCSLFIFKKYVFKKIKRKILQIFMLLVNKIMNITVYYRSQPKTFHQWIR